MADDRRIELSIDADDNASRVLDDVADKVDKLPDETTVEVDADTTQATSRLAKFEAELDKLDDQETIELRIEFRQQQLEQESRKLLRQLERLDDPVEIEVKQGELQRAQAELRELADLASRKYNVEVDADTSKAKAEIGDLSSALDDILGKLGGSAGAFGKLASAAGPIAGLVGVLGAAAAQTVEIGTEVQQIATVLGTSTEEASRLRAVFADVGVEASDLQDIGLQVTGALAGNVDLASRLKIGLDDAANPAEALKAAIDGWDFLSATERSQLFGEEGVRQIGALIAAGTDLDDLLAGVEKRRVLSDEDVENARRVAKITADFKAQIEGLALAIGGPLVSAIDDLDSAIRAIPGLDEGLFGEIGTALDDALSPGSHASDDTLRDWELLGNEAGEAYIRGIITRAGGGVTGFTDKVVEQWAVVGEAGTKAVDDVVAANERAIESEQRHFAELGKLDGQYDNVGRTGVREWDAIRDAENDARRALGDYDAMLRGLGDDRSLLDVRDQFDQLNDAAVAYLDATIAKSDDVEQKQRDHERALIDTKVALANYLTEVAKIPPDVVTTIVAQFDEFSIDQINAYLTNLERGIDIPLRPYVPPRYGLGGVPRDDSGTGFGSRMAPLTVNVRTDATMRQVDRAVSRWRRLNGGG